MGLLGKFFGPKKEELRVEKIEFAQLPSWIAERKKELESGLDELAAPVVKGLPNTIKNINSALDLLEKAKMQKEVHQRIISVVSSSRDNYVARARKIVDGIETRKGALELHDELGKALNEMKIIDLKYGERAAFGFEKEISGVRKWLTELAAAFEGINCVAGERKEKLKLVGEADEILTQINKKAEEIKNLEKREKETSDASIADKKDIESKGDKVKELENSANAKKLAAIRANLEILKGKKQEIEMQVLNILGPLKRAFKKYAKAIEEGKASGFNVDKYSEDPAGAYLRGDNTLPELLAKLQRAIQTKVISLEGGEDEKIVRKIRSITFAYLEKSRQEHTEICARIRHLEVEAAGLDVSKDIEKLQREESSLKEKAESENKSVAKIEEEIAGKKSEVSELNKKLVEKLSEFIKGRCEVS